MQAFEFPEYLAIVFRWRPSASDTPGSQMRVDGKRLNLSFCNRPSRSVPGVHELDDGLENSIGTVRIPTVQPELAGAAGAHQNSAILVDYNRPTDTELPEAVFQQCNVCDPRLGITPPSQRPLPCRFDAIE